MLKQGTLEKIFDYYFQAPQFEEEINRANEEFFDKGRVGSLNEKNEVFFNEWLLFDFRLNNGKTLLDNFISSNPLHLSQQDMDIYKQIQKNRYGLYEVLQIKLGKGLLLRDVRTNKEYFAREFLGTFGIPKKGLIAARVAKIFDHYELIGGKVPFLPIEFSASARKFLRQTTDKITPKEMYQYFYAERKQEREEKKPQEINSFEEAERKLSTVLAKYDLDKMADCRKIKHWIYNSLDKEGIFSFLNMVLGLVDPAQKGYKTAIKEIIDALNIFYNYCPQKCLNNKSPSQLEEEHLEKDSQPELKIDIVQIPYSGWTQAYRQSIRFFKNFQFQKAVEKLNQVFEELLKHRATTRDIFRLFANKGVAHFGVGEAQIGKRLLEISLEINPNYKFAKIQLESYKTGKLSEVINYAKQQRMDKMLDQEETLLKDPAYLYWQFLKKYQINFAVVPAEATIVTPKMAKKH